MTAHPDPAGADAARLAAIRSREEAASRGPWIVSAQDYHDGMMLTDWWVDFRDNTLGAARLDAACNAHRDTERGMAVQADCDFVAHAREDVPWLLAERDRLAREVAAYAKANDEWAEQYHREAEARIEATEKAYDLAREVERLTAQRDGLRTAIEMYLEEHERFGRHRLDLLDGALAPGDGRGA